MDRQVLLLAIIQREDKESASTALTRAGFQVTHISSMGGFLETGNTTLLIGLRHAEISRAVHLLKGSCRKRTAFVNTAMEIPAVGMQHAILPIEVQVGGGTIFVLPVARVVRLGEQRGDMLAESPAPEENGMKLVMAIVPEEHTDRVMEALTTAQYPATRISTTGGFLRKGNATLLIGVDVKRVDGVLKEIEGACRSGILGPDSLKTCATVFVLDVEQYLHF